MKIYIPEINWRAADKYFEIFYNVRMLCNRIWTWLCLTIVISGLYFMDFFPCKFDFKEFLIWTFYIESYSFYSVVAIDIQNSIDYFIHLTSHLPIDTIEWLVVWNQNEHKGKFSVHWFAIQKIPFVDTPLFSTYFFSHSCITKH